MRKVVISLERATERRARVAREFSRVGLRYEVHDAVDGERLTADQLALADDRERWRMGRWPAPPGALACWLSHRAVMRDLAEHGPETMAVFEDDVRLDDDIGDILRCLARRPFAFDVVFLGRRRLHHRFIPRFPLTERRAAGRVRYWDVGLEGYVISREAARHFIETTPRMVHEIDRALHFVAESRLNTFYVDPPVVSHEQGRSYIHPGRIRARREMRRERGLAAVYLTAPWRIVKWEIRNGIRQRLLWPKLLRGEVGVSR